MTKAGGDERKTQEILTKQFKHDWTNKCERTLGLAKQLGNIYTGSLYNGLITLVCDTEVDLTNKQVMMFSYGSGCAASMFVLRFTSHYKRVASLTTDYIQRLAHRRRVDPKEYDQVMNKREVMFGKNDFKPTVSFVLSIITNLYRTRLPTCNLVLST